MQTTATDKFRFHDGFIVIGVIALAIVSSVIAIAFTSLTGTTECSEVGQMRSDLKNIEMSLVRYKTNKRALPSQEEGLVALTKPGASLGGGALLKSESIMDVWGHALQYRNPGKRNPMSYDLFSVGPDGIIDSSDDVWLE